MGQRVEILPNHGDDSSVRRQHDQCHLEAGGGSSAANSGTQVDWGNQIGSKTRGGSQQDQEAYNILCIFVLVTCVDGVMIS